MSVIFGFTGTKQGMTPKQAGTVLLLMKQLKVSTLHHGVCVGADAQAHQLARSLLIRLVGHPPADPRFRASGLVFDEVREPFPYLVRNRHIIAEGVNGIIAATKDFEQPKNLRGQGTWTTIGYAVQAKRDLWIVYPDGTYQDGKP